MASEKKKQDPFWIGMGVLGAGVVGFFAVMIWPLWSESEALHEEIVATLGQQIEVSAAKSKGVSDQAIRDWDKYKKAKEKQYEDSLAWLAEMDGNLERWFDSSWVSAPRQGEFEAKYRNERESIEKQFADRGIQIGYDVDTGFGGQRPGGFQWDETEAAPEKLRTAQKKFWIRKKIANACLATRAGIGGALDSKVGVMRLEEIRFTSQKFAVNPPSEFKDFPNWPERPGAKPEEIPYVLPNVPQADPKAPEKNFGRTITVGVRVQMYAEQVPLFLRALVDTNEDPKLLIRLRAWDIAKFEKMGESAEAAKNRDPLVVEVLKGQPPPPTPIDPRPLRVSATLEIVDFEKP